MDYSVTWHFLDGRTGILELDGRRGKSKMEKKGKNLRFDEG